MALHLGNRTQKEVKACVTWRDKSRKYIEDILIDPPYRTMQSVYLVGNEAICEGNPQWNYLVNSIGRNRWDHMITHLIEGMKKFTVKLVKYERQNRSNRGRMKIL